MLLQKNSHGEQRNHRVGGERPLFVLSSCEIRDSLKHSMERKRGIPSAWLTGMCLLGWDKALLSPCPSPELFSRDKIQKEMEKIPTCGRNGISAHPVLPKYSRQGGHRTLGRGREAEEPRLGKNSGRQKFDSSLDEKFQRLEHWIPMEKP